MPRVNLGHKVLCFFRSQLLAAVCLHKDRSMKTCSVEWNNNNSELTYLPHKAAAEVSKDKEPIGRECAEFNWFESQLIHCQTGWGSNDLVVIWFEIQMIGCQLIWDSIDLVVNWIEILVVNRCVLQMILVVCWLEFQVMWFSIDLRFKWFGCQLMCDSNDFGCQLMWDSSDLDFECFEIQVSWWSIDLRFKWLGCQLTCALNDFGC